jgi:Domain of Unknown Function with PDB structure (DUF3857)/Transglutaminase-like superfamily
MKIISIQIVLVLFCFLLLPVSIVASGNQYDVNNIPSSLLINADAVIRNSTTTFEIEDESSAEETVTYVVTVLDKDGRGYGALALPHDKFREIDDLDGKILDSKGDEIRELNDDDIKDFSDEDGFSLYQDSRVKVAELYYDQYPYTVEYTYKISLNGYISWPTWYSRRTLDPVELSQFVVKVPENYNLRYNSNDGLAIPKVSLDGRTYSWEAKDLTALSYDVVGEDIDDVATIVRIAPSNFEIDGYKGNMDSWKNFGIWYNQLCQGRDVLPEDAVKEVKTLISPNDNDSMKVVKLYKYMQSRTRYVSVQLGIGGWQPFDASYVYKHGYGDCKALSNYMIALLKTVGIAAYPVLIYAGRIETHITRNFPNNQFNHVVVYVPLKKDSLWLECTSETESPGEVEWQIENREALLVTPKGGVLIRTPKSSFQKNLQITKINVKLSPDGAQASGVVKWTGDQKTFVRYLMNQTPEDQRKWILSSFEVANTVLNKSSFVADDTLNPHVDLNINIQLPNYGTVSGSRIFFNPNLADRRTSVPADVAKRLSPIKFDYPYTDLDSITYTIPSGYNLEAHADSVNLSSSFADFSSKVVPLPKQKILYVRSLQIKKYYIPAAQYDDYRKFFSGVVKSDRAQVVLVKNNQG